MPLDIRVRRARESDLHKLIDFNLGIALETEGTELSRGVVTSGVKRLFEHPEYGFYLVAEVHRRVVGALMVTTEWSDWRDGLFWWIQSVYVMNDFRRRGIYRTLYETARSLATEHPDVCGCRLYVDRNNQRARRTYKSLGMKATDYMIYQELFDR